MISTDLYKPRGYFAENEALHNYNSLKVGGKAKYYFRPFDLDDLSNFLKNFEGEVLFLGLGSNLLIRDGGFNGAVIHLHKTLQDISFEGELIRIEAGVTCAKIAKLCSKRGLAEAEFFAGIPGTMGGALAMNAGAFGSETWEFVKEVDVINSKGEVVRKSREDFEVGYRTVKGLPQEWFVAGYLEFKQGLGTASISDLLKKRNLSQPIGSLSCGSVFKNPPKNYAAKLIEASKLKGIKRGNVIVSDKHANFILNCGGAKAKDIEDLILHIIECVWRDHGIKLQPEVKIVGVLGD